MSELYCWIRFPGEEKPKPLKHSVDIEVGREDGGDVGPYDTCFIIVKVLVDVMMRNGISATEEDAKRKLIGLMMLDKGVERVNVV